MKKHLGLDGKTKLNLFLDAGSFRIFSCPSNWPYCDFTRWINQLQETDYLFFLDWNPIFPDKTIKDKLSTTNGKVIFLSSSIEAHEFRTSLGLRSLLVSNNIFVNESVFKVTNNVVFGRTYRAVYTARAAAFKRLHLAAAVDDLALVVDRTFKSGIIDMDPAYQRVARKYINDRPLTPVELTNLYNNTSCGLMLSTIEGACFTVVEYLLSGIPVVSTRAETPIGLGGRELWLNCHNSVYVEPNPKDVADGVNALISRSNDPLAIRTACINEMQRQRSVLTRALDEIFKEHNCMCSAKELMSSSNSWLNTSSKRHRFSAEYVDINLDETLRLLMKRL